MGSGRRDLHELEDIEVEEVSVVDRPANKRRFLFWKRSDDMGTTGPEVVVKDGKLVTEAGDHVAVKLRADWQETILSKAADALERLASVVELVKGADVEDGATFPEELSNEMQAVADAIAAIPKDVAGVDKACKPGDEGKKPKKKEDDGGDTPNVSKAASDAHWMKAMKELVDFIDQQKKAPHGAPNRKGPSAGAGEQPDKGVIGDVAQVFSQIPGMAALMKSMEGVADSLRELNSLRGTVEKQAETISELRSGIGLPASDGDPTSVEKSDLGGDVEWPMDMNEAGRGSRME